LAAVDKTVRDLNGTLTIHSEMNKGTDIVVFIPYY